VIAEPLPGASLTDHIAYVRSPR